MCPEGDYPAQITELRLREGRSEKVPVTWANLDLQWQINDDDVQKQLNMDKVIVTQQIMADLVLDNNGNIATPVRFDWGINKNRVLKNVMEATGIKKTNFALNDLKFQTGFVRVKHEADRDGATNADGTPIAYARINRVTSLNSQRR
jgi:hypothetical protein